MQIYSPLVTRLNVILWFSRSILSNEGVAAAVHLLLKEVKKLDRKKKKLLQIPKQLLKQKQ